MDKTKKIIGFICLLVIGNAWAMESKKRKHSEVEQPLSENVMHFGVNHDYDIEIPAHFIHYSKTIQNIVNEAKESNEPNTLLQLRANGLSKDIFTTIIDLVTLIDNERIAKSNALDVWKKIKAFETRIKFDGADSKQLLIEAIRYLDIAILENYFLSDSLAFAREWTILNPQPQFFRTLDGKFVFCDRECLLYFDYFKNCLSDRWDDNTPVDIDLEEKDVELLLQMMEKIYFSHYSEQNIENINNDLLQVIVANYNNNTDLLALVKAANHFDLPLISDVLINFILEADATQLAVVRKTVPDSLVYQFLGKNLTLENFEALFAWLTEFMEKCTVPEHEEFVNNQQLVPNEILENIINNFIDFMVKNITDLNVTYPHILDSFDEKSNSIVLRYLVDALKNKIKRLEEPITTSNLLRDVNPSLITPEGCLVWFSKFHNVIEVFDATMHKEVSQIKLSYDYIEGNLRSLLPVDNDHVLLYDGWAHSLELWNIKTQEAVTRALNNDLSILGALNRTNLVFFRNADNANNLPACVAMQNLTAPSEFKFFINKKNENAQLIHHEICYDKYILLHYNDGSLWYWNPEENISFQVVSDGPISSFKTLDALFFVTYSEGKGLYIWSTKYQKCTAIIDLMTNSRATDYSSLLGMKPVSFRRQLVANNSLIAIYDKYQARILDISSLRKLEISRRPARVTIDAITLKTMTNNKFGDQMDILAIHNNCIIQKKLSNFDECYTFHFMKEYLRNITFN